MPRENYYKRMFFVGAVWNWLATVPFAIGYRFLFPLLGLPDPNYVVFLQLFLGLAFVYGLGYYWVSRDIHRNHGIVRMGIIGKLIVFAGFVRAWIAGEIPWFLIGPGIVDLIFAVMFMEFLVFYGKQRIIREETK